MSSTPIPTGLLDTIIAIASGVLFTLVGIIYRHLRSKIRDLESNVADLESQLIETTQELEVAYTWMFGRDADPTNGGMAQEIDDGFEGAEESRKELKKKMEEIIDALHDEEEIDFDRDEIHD